MVARICAVVAILAVVALYCYFTAVRLDDLHSRVDTARAALDTQLYRRAQAALGVAAREDLPADMQKWLAGAAAAAAAGHGLGHEREALEARLGQAVAELGNQQPELFTEPSPDGAALYDEALRATMSRRFHNDAVRDALVVRDRRTVRYLRLAGSAPHPEYFEMDTAELPAPPR